MRRIWILLFLLCTGCSSVDLGMTVSRLPAVQFRSSCTEWVGLSFSVGVPERIRGEWFTGLSDGRLYWMTPVEECEGVCYPGYPDITKRWSCVKRLHLGFWGLVFNIRWNAREWSILDK